MRYDLAQLPLLKFLLRNRWPQFLLTSLALAGFLGAVLSGLFGTPVGSRNYAIIFVWIAWWALLMLIAVPFFGRAWCSICPIPVPGEWLQRGALLAPGKGNGFSLGRRWPRRFRNIWLQNGAFVLVASFSAVVLTQPRLTAIVLASFLFIATGTSLVFERRAFCRYLCPVGGFIGLYSQLAPLEVRVKDPAVCVAHTEKTCYSGSAQGYGCPWMVFPGSLAKNTYCGACLECLRTCTLDNIAINLRPLGTDLAQPRSRKLDEAYKAFIMLASAMAYALVLLGPWGQLKMAAFNVGSLPWLGYVLAFLIFILALLPGLFWLCVQAGGKLARWQTPPRRAFNALAQALLPLGLAAWIAFSLAFVFANLSYVWAVLSDPFGWGWDLFGTAFAAWRPYLTQVVPILQIAILLVGLGWSVNTASRMAEELAPGGWAWLGSIPVNLFCLGMTVALLVALVG